MGNKWFHLLLGLIFIGSQPAFSDVAAVDGCAKAPSPDIQRFVEAAVTHYINPLVQGVGSEAGLTSTLTAFGISIKMEGTLTHEGKTVPVHSLEEVVKEAKKILTAHLSQVFQEKISAQLGGK